MHSCRIIFAPKKLKPIIGILFLFISVCATAQIKERNMESERFNRGWEKLKEIDDEAGKKVIESLKEISPDLGRFIIEYSFGDIYSRDGLDLKSKEIAVVAALTALGNALPQLKFHIRAGLNVGLSEESIKEIMLLMTVYSGFPSAINGMNALKEVLGEGK